MQLQYILTFVCYSFITPFLISQETITDDRFYYQEKMDDPYMPPSKKTSKKSKAFKSVSENFFCTQVNIDVNGDNILNDAANEPSIAINALNPNEIVIGWRQFDNIQSNFRQAGYAYTTDGGLTWQNPPPIEPGVFRSDPVLGTDDQGRLYYNSLTVIDSSSLEIFAHTFMSEEIGQWDEGTYAFGGDKQWMAIGKNSIGEPRIYLTWSIFFTICEGNFTQSLDGGESYTDCEFSEFDSYLGTINVGRDNNLYAVGWLDNLLYVRISDHTSESLLWETNRIVDLDGSLASRIGPNPGGLLGQVDIATDVQRVDNQDYVYILSSVVSSKSTDPCDLMFARSTDGGLSFESPIRINTDQSTENYQWFGTMSVAPNGRIDVAWLDTRDEPGTFMSALYYSFSQDHGETWSANQKLTESFDPHVGWPNQPKMGDYFDMKSTDEGAHLAWCGTLNGEQDVYYSFIQPQEFATSLNDELQLENMIDINLLPNPSISLPAIELTSLLPADLNIQLTNIQGAILSKANVNIQGRQELSLSDVFELSAPLATGVYFLQISSQNYGVAVKKIIIQK